jgi:hypothetical protein
MLREGSVLVSFTLAIVVVGIVARSAFAQEPPWQPPAPDAKADDWIMLTSGEWLRGEIKVMRDEAFEFDSEELDLLNLDWGDIAELRSPRVLTYVFLDERSFDGTASMKDGVIKVAVAIDGTVHEYPRNQLLSIVEAADSELDLWSLKASVGLVARSGNTNQTDINTIISLRREADRTRFDVGYTGNFGELSGTQNINNHLANAKYDWYVARGFFVTPLALEYWADKFQNIDYRLTVAAGAGLDLYKKHGMDWYLQLFGGYLATRYLSVEPGADQEDESGTVIPATNFEWDITDDIEFDFNYNATIAIPQPRNTFHHAQGLLTIEFIGVLDLSLALTWDRNENPQPRADGSVPERDDFRTSFGLAVDI